MKLNCSLLAVTLALASCAPVPACNSEQTLCPFRVPVRGVAGSCVNLAQDASHCGQCNRPCTFEQTCVAAVCKSGCPLNGCSDVCENTDTNPNHCGACNVRCASGLSCIGGRCQSAVVMACNHSGGIAECADSPRLPTALPLDANTATKWQGSLMVADDTNHTLSTVSRKGLDWEVRSTSPLPGGPTRFAGNGLPWALSSAEGLVWRVDAQFADGGVDPGTSLSVGAGAVDLASNGETIWVAMADPPRVLQLAIAPPELTLVATHPVNVALPDGGTGIPLALVVGDDRQFGNSVYVAIAGAQEFVRLADGAPAVHIPIAEECAGVKSITTDLFWVALACEGKVLEVEPQTHVTRSWVAPPGFRPSFLAHTLNSLLVGDSAAGTWETLYRAGNLLNGSPGATAACNGPASTFVVFP